MVSLRQIRRLTGARGCVGVCLLRLTRLPLSHRSTAIDCPLNKLVSILSLSLSKQERYCRRQRALDFQCVFCVLKPKEEASFYS
ncbi:hypothetical protein RHMOL_Rhmol06G0170900 [Rhododendron molle]|uniref:Uncharacterized protein n=1 Tax=Rhododendron molle TaxID=49168 RepID=A0ACC0ND39_RHOML|nr:hypothetical protein RHMOL_Rhmol06G0170900 [Rhododendron molle]